MPSFFSRNKKKKEKSFSHIASAVLPPAALTVAPRTPTPQLRQRSSSTPPRYSEAGVQASFPRGSLSEVSSFPSITPNSSIDESEEIGPMESLPKSPHRVLMTIVDPAVDERGITGHSPQEYQSHKVREPSSQYVRTYQKSPSPHHEGRGYQKTVRSPSPHHEGRGYQKTVRSPSPHHEGRGNQKTARSPSPHHEGRGYQKTARSPSPHHEGRGYQKTARSPSPHHEGRGYQKTARSPSPHHEGRGYQKTARSPSPHHEGRGYQKTARSPSPHHEGSDGSEDTEKMEAKIIGQVNGGGKIVEMTGLDGSKQFFLATPTEQQENPPPPPRTPLREQLLPVLGHSAINPIPYQTHKPQVLTSTPFPHEDMHLMTVNDASYVLEEQLRPQDQLTHPQPYSTTQGTHPQTRPLEQQTPPTNYSYSYAANQQTHPPVATTQVQVHRSIEQTHPPIEQTHPPIEQTHPPIEQTHPPIEQTHPPIEQTHPPIEQTHPPESQPDLHKVTGGDPIDRVEPSDSSSSSPLKDPRQSTIDSMHETYKKIIERLELRNKELRAEMEASLLQQTVDQREVLMERQASLGEVEQNHNVTTREETVHSQLKRELDLKHQKCSELQSELKELSEVNRKVMEELSDAKLELQSAKDSHQKKFFQVCKELQKEKLEKEKIVLEYEAMRSAKTSLEGRLSETLKVNAKCISFEEHRNAMSKLQQAVDDLKEETREGADHLEQELESLKREKKSLLRKLADGKAGTVQLEQKCEVLKESLEEREAMIVHLQTDLERSKDKDAMVHVQLSKVVVQSERTAGERDSLVKMLKTQKETTAAQLKKYEAKVYRLEKQLKSHKDHSLQYMREVNELLDQQSEEQKQLQKRHEKDMSHLKRLLQDKKEELSVVSKEKRKLQEYIKLSKLKAEFL